MEGQSKADHNLPERLFGTDRYPDGRVNVYSRPEILSHVHTHLKGSEEWVIIKNSSFGKLFDLPVNMCYMSCKLLHSLLSRQLITTKKYELWTVYGGQPIKFSLAEFEVLTGLKCSDFPKEYDYNSNPELNDGEGSSWERYIGPDKKTNLSDLAIMITRKDKLPPWRRLGLTLLLIVEGVLIANHQGTKSISPKYVNMLGNINEFVNFPWGRESYLKTITSMLPQRITSTSEGGLSVFLKQMKQVSISLKGFPLSLQLLAFKRIPALVHKIPNATDMRTIIQVQFQSHANNASVTRNSCLQVEEDPELALQEIDLGNNAENKLWTDEVEDSKVLYMEGLIRNGHVFNASQWPGGDMTLPIILRRQGLSSTDKRKTNAKAKRVQTGNDNLDSATESSEKKAADKIEMLNHKIDEINKSWVLKQKESDNKWARKYKKLRQRMKMWERHSGIEQSVKGATQRYKERRPYSEYSTTAIPISNKEYTSPTDEKARVTNEERLAECNSKRKKKTTKDTAKKNRKRRPYSEFSTPTTPTNEEGCTSRKDEEPIVTILDSHSEGHRNLKEVMLNHRKSEPNQVQQWWIVPFSQVYTTWSAEFDLPMAANIQVIFSDQYGELHFSLPDIELSDIEYSTKRIQKKRKSNCKERHGCQKKKRKTKSGSGSNIEPVDVSDSSPTKPTEPTSLTVAEEKLVNIFICNSEDRTFTIYPDLDHSTYYLLRSTLEKYPDRHYVTENNYSFNNKFLLTLAKPSAWVDTQHMEMLMEMIGTRHAATMAIRRSCFVTPMFVNHIISQQKKFENSIDKSMFKWSPRIHTIVRKPGCEWLTDVDYVYLPMIWANRHWVGLVVNLRTTTIEVLDPDVGLTADRSVEKHLSLLTKALPFIIDQCCSLGDGTNILNRRFKVVRTTGLYQNKRSGDCGPVTAKFLEMHAHGDVIVSGSSMTDMIVDDIRKQYVMDIYQHYIVPLHQGLVV